MNSSGLFPAGRADAERQNMFVFLFYPPAFSFFLFRSSNIILDMRVGESGVGGVWGQLFGNDTLLTVLALILMLHARGYTQSILMQLAHARKDELFNGSIIASSSFYTGSFQGCNYFHTWFNSQHHRHIQYAHMPRLSRRHTHNHMELSWQVIHHTITQFYLIIQSRKVKLPHIRFYQCLHSFWIPKQRPQTLRV